MLKPTKILSMLNYIMSAYNPPKENLTIFDSALFRENEPVGIITIPQADRRYLKWPTAQGNETFADATVNGTLTVSGISTFSEEVIIQTDNGVSALPSLTLRDTVSNDNFLFNPNATGNTYNAIVETGDAVITTSNNNQALVLTNTSSTTTNGVRISTTATRLGNGGGGTDIPTCNLNFDSTQANPIAFTAPNASTYVSFSNGLTLGTAGVGEGVITVVGSSSSFFADFYSADKFTFKSNAPNQSTILNYMPTKPWSSMSGIASNGYYNASSVINSSAFVANINNSVNPANVTAGLSVSSGGSAGANLLPIGIYAGATKAITISNAGLVTFETAVTANANISFASAGAKLKYATGTAGFIPVSDNTGLLTLQSPNQLSTVTGTLPTEGSAYSIPNGNWASYGSIVLTAGTWLITGRIGITHNTFTGIISTTGSGFSTLNSGVPNTYLLGQYIDQANVAPLPRSIKFTEIQTIVTVASTTTYYLRAYMAYGSASMTFTVSTLAIGGQQLFATKIA